MKPLVLGLVLALIAVPATAQRNLKPAAAESFARAWVGKWTSEGCDNPGASYVAFASSSASELVVDFRTQSRVLAKNYILLDSVRYLGVADGMHRFAYRVESEIPGQSRNPFDVTLETDITTRRRTYNSVRVQDGTTMIKDGKLASGEPMPFLVKCE